MPRAKASTALCLMLSLSTIVQRWPSASSINLCSTAGLCCRHRNGNCVAQSPIDTTAVSANESASTTAVDTSAPPCYCDHACIHLDDCCEDYKEFCGVLDCMVSEWGPWSPCPVECDSSAYTERKRVVLRRPSNGGVWCPEKMTEKKRCKCQGWTDDETPLFPTKKKHREIGLHDRSRCIQVNLVWASSGCRRHDKRLYSGTTICIKCWDEDGACPPLTTARRFTLPPHCHGKLGPSLGSAPIGTDEAATKGLIFRLDLGEGD